MTDREDDFLASDWNDAHPVSDDFVELTLDRVMADRREIEVEADRVEEYQFPPGVLDQYATPELSSDFAERTAERVAATRNEAWQRTLESFAPPAPTEDFVERTLLALRIDRSNLRLVAGESARGGSPTTEQPSQARRNLLRMAGLAAASLALATVGLWSSNTDESQLVAVTQEYTTQTYSPVKWSTQLGQMVDDRNDDLHFQPIAAFAVRTGPRGGNR